MNITRLNESSVTNIALNYDHCKNDYATLANDEKVRTKRILAHGRWQQGRSDGGYMGIYTPQISPSKLFMG